MMVQIASRATSRVSAPVIVVSLGSVCFVIPGRLESDKPENPRIAGCANAHPSLMLCIASE
jgi:hypothetical protein